MTSALVADFDRVPFDNSYARLPARFFSAQSPQPVRSPALLQLNEALAIQLGLDPALLRSDAGLQVLAGNSVPATASPLAMVYAGHQFGGWSPQLGDGRALLLGELVDTTGTRLDIQLKGSGQTAYSRRGDGRAWVGPVVREFVVSEAMHALGVPTTRALAAVATGEPVYREAAQPGAVLTRVGQSHIRVGTFEYFAARRDTAGLELLTNYVIERHFPELKASNELPALALLKVVVGRQTKLVAHWQALGFIHGVMNTDNVSIVGDTIDYGPCAFMDTYHPARVFSAIDQQGRYSYQNQPRITQWNLSVLAQALLPLIINSEGSDEDAAVAQVQAAIDACPGLYAAEYLRRMRLKLGLGGDDGDDNTTGTDNPDSADLALVTDLLDIMAEQHADFTRSFRALGHLPEFAGDADSVFLACFDDGGVAHHWLSRWRQRLARERDDHAVLAQRMLAVNPVYIPRNHRLEEVIQAALNDELQPLKTLCDVLSQPFQERQQYRKFAAPPLASEIVQQTFCGT